MCYHLVDFFQGVFRPNLICKIGIVACVIYTQINTFIVKDFISMLNL